MITISNRITKILNRRNLNTNGKANALLELDCDIRCNLGTDSSKPEVSEAKNFSRKIYKEIKRLGGDWFYQGNFLLKTMDL